MFENGHTAPEHISPGLGHQLMMPGPISLGLVPQPPSPTPNVPATKNDRDTLFCPMFDEYFNPSPSVAQPVLEAAVQDTPSTSISQTIKEVQSHVIPTIVEEDDHGTVLHTWIMICNLVFQFQNLVRRILFPNCYPNLQAFSKSTTRAH
ncbi:hypothetical protein Tco_1187028 [Tanacetum coccineum]